MPDRPNWPKPRLHRMADEIVIEDDTWLSLGQLRALVRMADERGWDDTALISHGTGRQHITRHDVLIARRIVIEGVDPDPMVPLSAASPKTEPVEGSRG